MARYQHLLANGCQFVTTQAVVWEWLNFFADSSTRSICHKGYRLLNDDKRVEIVGFDDELCDNAIRLYSDRINKSWGVVDCLSLVVMQERGLTSALATDHHSQQAGFTALLASEPPK